MAKAKQFGFCLNEMRIFLFLMLCLFLLTVLPVYSQSNFPQSQNRGGGATAQTNTANEDPKNGGKDLLSAQVQGGVSRLNRLGTTDATKLIGRAIKAIMGVVGSLALLMFVAGGIMWMTARGNSEKTQKAIKTLAWSALGSIVILASYTLVDFIFKAIG